MLNKEYFKIEDQKTYTPINKSNPKKKLSDFNPEFEREQNEKSNYLLNHRFPYTEEELSILITMYKENQDQLFEDLENYFQRDKKYLVAMLEDNTDIVIDLNLSRIRKKDKKPTSKQNRSYAYGQANSLYGDKDNWAYSHLGIDLQKYYKDKKQAKKRLTKKQRKQKKIDISKGMSIYKHVSVFRGGKTGG